MKNIAKLATILSILTMSLLLSGLAFAAVPDKLECDAQPSVIHATWDPSNPSATEVTVQLLKSDNRPVKMCGVEIRCESQNPDILNNGTQNGAIVSGTTDEFGRAYLTFQSTGNRPANVNNVKIICRSLQLPPCETTVSVKAHIPNRVELSKCPNGAAWHGHGPYADIIADGESQIIIAAQLKDSNIPVKKSGIRVKFITNDTSKVRALDGTDMVETYTDDQGVAYATFVSAGSGEENEGTALISVQVDGGYLIPFKNITVETTRNYGTTTINGQLFLSTFPTQILADGTSTVQACVQLRKTDGLIIKDPPLKAVSLISQSTSRLLPVQNQIDPNNPAFTQIEAPNTTEFPQGGVYTTEFKSAGIYDPNSVGSATIRASADLFNPDTASVYLSYGQYWPKSFNVRVSPGKVLCDGVSTVKVTAQLLDRNGYPVFMSGRPVVFKSLNPNLIVDAKDGDAIAEATTNQFGVAYATFRVKDCKLDNINSAEWHWTAKINVSTISDKVYSDNNVIDVYRPFGYLPTGVNVYTDQNALGATSDKPAHASPALISADGQKPVYVTAQVCEWDSNHEFCNPVKRSGIRVEFKVMDDNIVMNKDQNGSEDGIDYVYKYTDAEGKATAVFRSTGTTSGTNEGCTKIKVTAQDGSILGTAYSEVCARQDEGTSPNAVWVWAQPAFITADGSSATTLRAALLWCTSDKLSSLKGKSQGTISAEDIMGDTSSYCKPVQLQGAEVKFEVDNPSIINNGIPGGRRIRTTTDQYGHASATFYSAGFDTPNIGKTAISVFVSNVSETVTQLNKLNVQTKEKTWPWCKVNLDQEYGTGASEADTNGDGAISDGELLNYIIAWFNGYPPFTSAGSMADVVRVLAAINAWQSRF